MLKQLLFVLVLCLVAVAMASAQDNLAGPWARRGANNAATASSTTPYRFSAHGPKLAWDIDLAAHGLTKVYGFNQLVFDENVNIYLNDESGFCASFDKDGTFRWKTAIGDNSDMVSPVVGNDAVYTIGITLGVSHDVYSLNKATGAVNWTFAAPEATTQWNAVMNPALYNGKLYVVTSFVAGNRQIRVRQVNAATGAIDFTSDIATFSAGGGIRGVFVFVPDVFGAGKHGIYLQSDDGNPGNDNVYAIKVDTAASAAVYEWSAPGGKISRQHMIYSPAYGGRIYSCTWGDYGNSFYAYDAVTGFHGDIMVPEDYWAILGGGHGWHDFRALVGQPDGAGELSRVFAGSFSGDYVLYHEDGAGNFTATLYDGPDEQGEGSTVGGLGGAREGVMLALTRTDPTIPTNVRFIAMDVTGASGTYGEIWDYDTGWEPGGYPGPVYAASGGPVLGPDGKIYFATQQYPGGVPAPTNPIPDGHLMAWEPLVDISGGDGDGNGVIDGLDLTGVISAFGTVQGDALFNWNYDFDYNGTIDGLDLTVVISNWTVASSSAPEASEAAKPGKRVGNVRKGR